MLLHLKVDQNCREARELCKRKVMLRDGSLSGARVVRERGGDKAVNKWSCKCDSDMYVTAAREANEA